MQAEDFSYRVFGEEIYKNKNIRLHDINNNGDVLFSELGVSAEAFYVSIDGKIEALPTENPDLDYKIQYPRFSGLTDDILLFGWQYIQLGGSAGAKERGFFFDGNRFDYVEPVPSPLGFRVETVVVDLNDLGDYIISQGFGFGNEIAGQYIVINGSLSSVSEYVGTRETLYASAINNFGQIVGFRSFSFTNGIGFVDPFFFDGTNISSISLGETGSSAPIVFTDMNDSGHVVGYIGGSGTSSFLWKNNQILFLDKSKIDYAMGVNNSGVIVGSKRFVTEFGVIVEPSDLPVLFTPNSDFVDFRALTAAQINAISSDLPIRIALAGDDKVTLPTAIGGINIVGTGVQFDFELGFNAGEGADTIDFSSTLWSRDYPAGSVGGSGILIDGGPQTDASTVAHRPDAKVDVLRLPGSPSDYTYSVAFQPAPAPGNTTITIQTPTVALVVNDFEKVIVSGPWTNMVALDYGNLYSEMAVLALEVYGPLAALNHVSDAPESLAYEPGVVRDNFGATSTPGLDIAEAAADRGWHQVSALELGMPPADFGLTAGGLRYSFVNGHYQAVIRDDLSNLTGILPQANALVLSGVVDGKKTLAVSFRGTDQYADWQDYPSFAAYHYAKFAPLVEALKSYTAAAGVEQVLVTGHSLGAGVAQIFAADIDPVFAGSIQLFTFGSPGGERRADGVAQVNFVNTDDAVPQLGFLTNLTTEEKAALVAASFVVPALGPVLGAVVAGVSFGVEAKPLGGGTTLLNTNTTEGVSLDEHSLGGTGEPFGASGFGYIQQVRALIDLARDAASPFHHSAFGQAIAAGRATSDSLPRIALSGGADARIASYADDDFALGAFRGGNTIEVLMGTEPNSLWVEPWAPTRIVDAGATGPGGLNRILLGGDVGRVTWTDPVMKTDVNNLHYLETIGAQPAYGSATQTVKLYRVEALYNPSAFASSGDPARMVIQGDGTPGSVQRAAPGQTLLVVDGGSDVAYAGLGVTNVFSSVYGAVIAFGADTTSVIATGVNGLLVSESAPTTNPVTIVPGPGTIVYGGPRPTLVLGQLAGLNVSGHGDGITTISYAARSDALTFNIPGGVVTSSVGTDQYSEINALTGGAGADIFHFAPKPSVSVGSVYDSVSAAPWAPQRLDAGPGFDLIVVDGARADFSITTAAGVVLLTAVKSGFSGTTFLEGFETFQFDDFTVTAADLISGVVTPPSPPTTPGPPAPIVDDSDLDIHRFYNTRTKTHFYTSSAEERDYVIRNFPQFQYEGNRFDATSDPAAGVSVHRFYNVQTQAHFYTASDAERDYVQRSFSQFQYEGIAYRAWSSAGDSDHNALYRFYNAQTKTHFYTDSAAEKAWVEATLPQFRYEYLAYYVDAAL